MFSINSVAVLGIFIYNTQPFVIFKILQIVTKL